MKPLSKAGLSHRVAAALFWGLLTGAVPACHPGTPPQARPTQALPRPAHALPSTRPAGPWPLPRDPLERRRLDAQLKDHFVSLQDCLWRYAGRELSGGRAVPLAPIVATVGVDRAGRVVWFEMSPDGPALASLRACLSERLSGIEFTPPPSEPVSLVLTLPQLKGRRLSGGGPAWPSIRARPGSYPAIRAG